MKRVFSINQRQIGVVGKGGVILAALLLMLTSSTRSLNGGTLFFSQDGSANGLYQLSTTTGAATLIGISGVGRSNVGLAEGPNANVLYGSQPFGLLNINADGTGSTVVNASLTYEGLAYDAANNVGYGSWWNSGIFESFDPSTGTVIANLASPPDDVEGLAYHNGIVYGLAGFGGNPRGNLWRYDVGLNNWSLIGNTGVPFDLCGLAYNPDLNVLYAIGAQDSNLYRINPVTAAATIIGSTGLGITGGGLAYVVPEPSTIGLCVLGAFGVLWVGRRPARQV